LINVLETIRLHIDRPIHVVSGKRCARHNARVGGVRNSQHKLGNAADIRVVGIKSADLYKIIDNIHLGGLGLYANFVHVDVRSKNARWTG